MTRSIPEEREGTEQRRIDSVYKDSHQSYLSETTKCHYLVGHVPTNQLVAAPAKVTSLSIRELLRLHGVPSDCGHKNNYSVHVGDKLPKTQFV